MLCKRSPFPSGPFRKNVVSCCQKETLSPWPYWLSGLSAGLWTEKSPVRFLVRSHPWIAGFVPSGRVQEATDRYFSHTPMFLSLSFSLPSPLKRAGGHCPQIPTELYQEHIMKLRRELTKEGIYCLEIKKMPWLMWLSGLSAGLWTKRLLVRFPVGAHAWVAGEVPSWGCVRGNWSMFFSHIDVSLPLWLPPFPSLWK